MGRNRGATHCQDGTAPAAANFKTGALESASRVVAVLVFQRPTCG